MSFSVDLKSAIQFLVDANRVQSEWGVNLFSEGNITKRRGIYVSTRVSVRNFEWDDVEDKRIADDVETCNVHMVFCGNTSVFYFADKNQEFRGVPDLSRFANTSNHDTCWRSDGFRELDALYFELCEKVAPHRRPVDLDSESSWILWTSCKPVWIKYESKSDYGYNLVDLEVTR